jgi:hypothetical protein
MQQYSPFTLAVSTAYDLVVDETNTGDKGTAEDAVPSLYVLTADNNPTAGLQGSLYVTNIHVKSAQWFMICDFFLIGSNGAGLS